MKELVLSAAAVMPSSVSRGKPRWVESTAVRRLRACGPFMSQQTHSRIFFHPPPVLHLEARICRLFSNHLLTGTSEALLEPMMRKTETFPSSPSHTAGLSQTEVGRVRLPASCGRCDLCPPAGARPLFCGKFHSITHVSDLGPCRLKSGVLGRDCVVANWSVRFCQVYSMVTRWKPP